MQLFAWLLAVAALYAARGWVKRLAARRPQAASPELPAAALHSVLSNLQGPELARVCSVSKQWNKAAASSRLWSELHQPGAKKRSPHARVLVRTAHLAKSEPRAVWLKRHRERRVLIPAIKRLTK